MKFSALFVLIIGLVTSARVWAGVETCLLSFERAIHPVSKYISNQFGDAPSIEIVIEARPIDLLRCVDIGARKIVMIAHAVSVSVGENNEVVSLGYFKRLEGDEREQYISGWSEYLKDKEENKFHRIPNVLRRPLQRQKRKLEEALNAPELPLYGSIHLFLPRIFERLYEQVAAPNSRLESIHIMACETEELKKRYPTLESLKELGVQLHFAPKNKILSALKDREVTSLSRRWIRKAVTQSEN